MWRYIQDPRTKLLPPPKWKVRQKSDRSIHLWYNYCKFGFSHFVYTPGYLPLCLSLLLLCKSQDCWLPTSVTWWHNWVWFRPLKQYSTSSVIVALLQRDQKQFVFSHILPLLVLIAMVLLVCEVDWEPLQEKALYPWPIKRGAQFKHYAYLFHGSVYSLSSLPSQAS